EFALREIKRAVLGNCWLHAHFLIELFNLETPIGFRSRTGFLLVCAPARTESSRAARDGDCRQGRTSTRSKSTISLGPTATASHRYGNRVEIRDDSCDSPRRT